MATRAGGGRSSAAARGVGRFPKALVAASVGAIRDRWRPEPAPEWVTSIPTRGRSAIVGDFAAAVAAELGLPYLAMPHDRPRLPAAARHAEQRPPAGERAGKAQHHRRLARPAGPVLLIDDIVDSRWTMTVAGSLLREQGSGPVLPFALAAAGAGDD